MSPSDLLDELILLNAPQEVRCFYLPSLLYAELLEEMQLDASDGRHVLHQGIPVVEDKELPQGAIEPVRVPSVLPSWVSG